MTRSDPLGRKSASRTTDQHIRKAAIRQTCRDDWIGSLNLEGQLGLRPVPRLLNYSQEMKVAEATALICTPLIEWARPQSWCDLGSGKGTFTIALAQLLTPGSTIYAIDFDQGALEGIPDKHEGVEIRKIVGDLRSSALRLPSVDGILVANTLHFIPDQQVFLRRLLSVADRCLIVEYERSRPNRWGPYPVGFERLRQLFSEAGVERMEKLATRPSLFGGTIYSAFADRSCPS